MPVDKLRQHLARGEYVQARREAERLIHVGNLTGKDLVLAYRFGAQAHFCLQEIFAAVKLGERALETATADALWEQIGRARFDLGSFYLSLGDVHLAREHLLDFLANMDRYPEAADLESHAYHNLALTHRHRRDYDNAIAAHQMAITLARKAFNTRLEMDATRGIIWCHLIREDPDAAWPYIQAVEAHLEESPDDRLSARLLTDLAGYYRLKGNIKKSMDFCEEALMPGRPGVDDHVLATACLLAGENAVDIGRYHEASIFANLALDYALKAKGPFLMNRASVLRRRITELSSSADQVS